MFLVFVPFRPLCLYLNIFYVYAHNFCAYVFVLIFSFLEVVFMLKIISVLLIFVVTVISGFYPFFSKQRSTKPLSFPRAESLSAGVFLGAALIHMLADASSSFNDLHFDYPVAFLLAGITFLLLLLLEHIGREIYEHKRSSSTAFALLSVLMLSVHSFLAGAALGLSMSTSITIMLLIAILGHKWAASFALSVQINKSQMSFRLGMLVFLVFALMVPLGVVCGAAATHFLSQLPWLVPVFSSLAAGTFLYLGSLHGLEQSILVKSCCNLSIFSFVIIGFAIMALVAVWL